MRLLKWWKDFQASLDGAYYLRKEVDQNGEVLRDKSPPSFLLNLLAAKAYDYLSVERTYGETLFRWSGYLSHVIDSREPVLFQDYNRPQKDESSNWTVMDPVNPENNVVRKWSSSTIDELVNWFNSARDDLSRIIHFDNDGDDTKSLDYQVKLFGNPFKNHCEG